MASLGLLTAVALAAPLGACVTRPVYAPPWYDLDLAWVNDDLGGWAPRRPVDRARLTRAAFARERRWAVEEIAALKARLAEERRVVRAMSAARRRLARRSAGATRARRQNRRRATGSPTRARSARVAAAPREAPKRRRGRARRGDKATRAKRKARQAHAGRASRRAQRTRRLPAPATPSAAVRLDARPVLGDGTVPSELLAAAQRLLGVESPFPGDSMLRHLLVVAAAPLTVRAPASRFLAAAWAAARAAGRAREPRAYRPKPGDVALFGAVADAPSGPRRPARQAWVAVVEQVRPSGVVVCIGEVGEIVRRFHMDPRRPWVVRDERTGETVNDPLARRSLWDGPETPTLAGALLAGYISF